jgi:hypothetical protein
MQLQEGDFVQGLVQDFLRQLGAGGRDLPQQFIKYGMQGSHSVTCGLPAVIAALQWRHVFCCSRLLRLKQVQACLTRLTG